MRFNKIIIKGSKLILLAYMPTITEPVSVSADQQKSDSLNVFYLIVSTEAMICTPSLHHPRLKLTYLIYKFMLPSCNMHLYILSNITVCVINNLQEYVFVFSYHSHRCAQV